MASNGSGRVGRFGAWMGIVFAVTFIVGNIIQPVPTHQKNTTEWQHLFNNSGKRTREVLGAYLVVFGLLAFLWFVSRLRSVLKDGSGAMLAFASVFAGLSFVATLVAATVAGGKIFVGTPIPSDGAIVQQLNNMSGALFSVPVPLTAGVFVAVASYLAAPRQRPAGVANDGRLRRRRPAARGVPLRPAAAGPSLGAHRLDRADATGGEHARRRVSHSAPVRTCAPSSRSDPYPTKVKSRRPACRDSGWPTKLVVPDADVGVVGEHLEGELLEAGVSANHRRIVGVRSGGLRCRVQSTDAPGRTAAGARGWWPRCRRR